MTKHKKIMTAAEMARTLERLAFELIERHEQGCGLALVGIQRRGAELASRLKGIIEDKLKCAVPLGKLDINLYRDDWTTSKSTPNINATRIDFPVEDKTVILVDDVLFTGRTIRSALEAILDFGRPRCVKLLVLVDRGHRELPIQADFTGKTVSTGRDRQINVFLKERDGLDQVVLT